MELAGDRRPGLGKVGELCSLGEWRGEIRIAPPLPAADLGPAHISDHDPVPSCGLACLPGLAGDLVDQ